MCVIISSSHCLLCLGKPIPHWSVMRGLPKHMRLNNVRICLLIGCDGLVADASRFRRRKYAAATENDPTCRLCKLEPEVPAHFIVHFCPSLHDRFTSPQCRYLHIGTGQVVEVYRPLQPVLYRSCHITAYHSRVD